MNTANLRTEYLRSALDEQVAGDEPMALFHRWFGDAVATGAQDANAMTLATCDAQGQASARIVLCKEFDERGFVFFTNYDSRKGRELEANPRASLLFYWASLERQVRIAGTVARVAPEESDSYFSQRPRAARIGAWASPQSQEIATRVDLERRVAEFERRYPGASEPPRPPHWGGFRLAAESIEFWQGRPSRLHDRLLFVRRGESWERSRLAP
jgi:pyridoxamine 5'-phosphate oxidase